MCLALTAAPCGLGRFAHATLELPQLLNPSSTPDCSSFERLRLHFTVPNRNVFNAPVLQPEIFVRAAQLPTDYTAQKHGFDHCEQSVLHARKARIHPD